MKIESCTDENGIVHTFGVVVLGSFEKGKSTELVQQLCKAREEACSEEKIE